MKFEELFCLIGMLAFNCVCAQQSPIVKTKSGPGQGKLIQFAPARQDVYQFTAIPFAEPPTGERRFKKPVPKAPWNDVLDATKVTNACIQVVTGPGDPFESIEKELIVPGVQFSEDCLYLNLWVPRATLDAVTSGKPTKPLSVYVYIHGGGFVSGMTMMQLYNGTMISGFDNIIVATIQYRLGSLGFAYFGKNDDAPGNVGLWDQMEALKWISENIASFGGNSSDVTIGGESAGAASVTYHLLSPYSRNYFHKAVIQSGAAIAPWASHTPDVAVEILNIVLNQSAPGKCDPSLGAPSSPADKLKCLRSVDAMTIAKADGVLMRMGYASETAPTIDGDFVPKDPSTMLLSGDFYKIPLLMGANLDEGSMLFLGNAEARKLLPPEGPSLDSLNLTSYNKLIEIGFAISSTVPQPSINPILFNAIQLHYWPTNHAGFPSGAEIIKAASEALGDYLLKCPTYAWATVAANVSKTPIFVYHFTQQPPKVWLLPDWVGPFHGLELGYIFGVSFQPILAHYAYNNEELLLSKTIMEYWGNFIKYGDPSVRDQYAMCNDKSAPFGGAATSMFWSWPQYSGKNCPYQFFEINKETVVSHRCTPLTCAYKARDCLFWTDLFPKLISLSGQHKSPPK